MLLGIGRLFKKKLKKNITISQKEHDEWHRKHKDYDEKGSKEHDICHRKFGIAVKKKR
jgi:hypothetical protein